MTPLQEDMIISFLQAVIIVVLTTWAILVLFYFIQKNRIKNRKKKFWKVK